MNQSDLNYVKQAEAATYDSSILSALTVDTYFLSSWYIPALLIFSIIAVQANLRRHYSMAPEIFGKDCDGEFGNQCRGNSLVS